MKLFGAAKQKAKKFELAKIVVNRVNDGEATATRTLKALDINSDDFEIELTVYITDQNRKYGCYVLTVASSAAIVRKIEQNKCFFINRIIAVETFDHDSILNSITNRIMFAQSSPVQSWNDFDCNLNDSMLPIFYSPKYLPDPVAPEGFSPWRHRFSS